MNKVIEDRIKGATKHFPEWIRVFYEDGALWIDGMKQSKFKTSLYVSLFEWEHDIGGYVRFSKEGITFYSDEEMKCEETTNAK